jgi:RNA-binding protein YlmH
VSIYEHFRKEEHPFIDQVSDWKKTVEEEYRSKLSDFLDPRQQHIVSSIVGGNSSVSVMFEGGISTAERKRALLYPDYVNPATEDFELKAFELDYPVKFVRIDHPQVLGSLIGLGLKREKFGDIITKEDKIQFVCASENASYIEHQLTSIGKAKVSLLPIKLEDLVEKEESYIEKLATVSSLRLDVIISEAYNLSRSKVKPFIQSDKVKVNWRISDDPSLLVEKGDMLSLRGKGRCQIVSIEGETKKGKVRIILRYIGSG